jgi:thiamine transporter ThiT
MLTIAILSGMGMILSIISNALNEKCDVNLIMATIFIISTWQMCLPLSIIAIVVSLLIGLINLKNK